MFFSWNWPSAQATSGAKITQTTTATGVLPTAPAPAIDTGEDLDVWAVATANYSATEKSDAPARQVSAVLVAAFQASAVNDADATQRAAVDASSQLAHLPINIANGATTELNPYKMGSPL